MMKTIISLLFALPTFAYAQNCPCTILSSINVKKITQDNRILNTGDEVNVRKNIQVDNKTAIIRIDDMDGEKYSISFIGGQRITKKNVSKKRSELYEIALAEYLPAWLKLSGSILTTKNIDFDWFEHFVKFDEGKSHRLLIVDGERIPLKSKQFKLQPDHELYACVYDGKDSTETKLDIKNNEFILSKETIGSSENLIYWRLKIRGNSGNKKVTVPISDILISSILSMEDFKKICYFLDIPNKPKQYRKKHIYTFLTLNYGKFNPSQLEQIDIDSAIKNR